MVGCKSRFGIGKCVCEMSDEELLFYECDFAEACDYDEQEILEECDQSELTS